MDAFGRCREVRNSPDDRFVSRGLGGPFSRSRQGGPKATSAASGTDQGNGDDPPAVLSGREAHELSSWGRVPATGRGRTRGQSQHLEGEPVQLQVGVQPEVADALLAAAYEWKKSGTTLKSTSWTTEDAMAMTAEGLSVEENEGELKAGIPSGFPENVEPPPQSVADRERSQHKAAWHEAMKIELDGHRRPVRTKPRHRREGGNL